MSGVEWSAASRVTAPQTTETQRDPKLEKAVREFHSLFFQQLFKALRDTVPEGSGISGGSDYGFFMDQMDEELSQTLAARMDRGLGSALYRALVELQATVEAPEASSTNEAGS